jgi:hypothetical protein
MGPEWLWQDFGEGLDGTYGDLGGCGQMVPDRVGWNLGGNLGELGYWSLRSDSRGSWGCGVEARDKDSDAPPLSPGGHPRHGTFFKTRFIRNLFRSPLRQPLDRPYLPRPQAPIHILGSTHQPASPLQRRPSWLGGIGTPLPLPCWLLANSVADR